MTRLTVLLLLLCGIACSRQAPSQEKTAATQQPAAAPASSQAEPPPQSPEAPPPAPSAGDQPTGASPNAPAETAAGTSPGSSTAALAPAVAPPAAAAAPVPRFREITVPAETPLSVTLESSIASDTSQVEDPVEGHLARAIVVSHTTVVPAGARLMGSVIDAKRSGRVKGRASIAVRFDRVVVHGEPYQIQTARITREATASTKGDVKKGGIGAGVGAIVGGIAGGGKGAAIGGVLGGTGTVLATRGKEVQLPAGTTLTTRLTTPFEVRVAVSDGAAKRDRSPEP